MMRHPSHILPAGAPFLDALDTLRLRCAPELGALVYNAQLPDSALATILDWARDLGAADPAPALAIDRLEDVFPSLVVALVASHGYSLEPDPRGGGRELVMADLGDGFLVQRTLAAAVEVALALHEEAGADLLRRTHAELCDKLGRLSEMIARRG